VNPTGDRRFRLVTHCWVDEAGIRKAIGAIKVPELATSSGARLPPNQNSAEAATLQAANLW
jgi:hypothetical protein